MSSLSYKRISQVEDLDFDQIFSPVVCYETVHLMLALAALENWHMEAVDIQSAYIYGKLNEEIFMEQLKELKIPGSENKVLHLKKALYGLKQAGLTWWNTLNDPMKELGFEWIKSDPGIFLYKRKDSLMVVAVTILIFFPCILLISFFSYHYNWRGHITSNNSFLLLTVYNSVFLSHL